MGPATVKRRRLARVPFYTKLSPMDAITEDLLLNGRIRLRQPARGYRAGMDAALLAAACDAKADQRVLEVVNGRPSAVVFTVNGKRRKPGPADEPETFTVRRR